MADISKITLPSGTTYNIKDTQARSDIADIQSSIAGGLAFLGETTTELTDDATTNPITINSASVTAKNGDLAVYGKKEFLFNGTKWVEMGDLSLVKALAYKDSASGSYTPTGTVSQPTFTGSTLTSTGTFTPVVSVKLAKHPSNDYESETYNGFYLQTALTKGNKNFDFDFTPQGTVSAPTISVKTAGSTTTVNSLTAVGTLPALGATVANETLTLTWDAGTLPTKGSNTTVKTGDAEYQATAPTFTGAIQSVTCGVSDYVTGATTKIFGSTSSTPNIYPWYALHSSGTQGNISVTGTPSGTVSQPAFTGTADTVTVS